MPANASYGAHVPRKRDNVFVVIDAEELLKHRAGQIILVIDHYGRAIKPREHLSFFIL
jgi:hypothetical protein